MCALVTGVQPFARPIFLLAVCNLGVIASTAPLAAFSAAFGWRGAFLVTAALTVLLFGLSWLAIRDRPATTGNDTPAPETIGQKLRGLGTVRRHPAFPSLFAIFFNVSSEERRVGEECVHTGRFRLSPVPLNNHN